MRNKGFTMVEVIVVVAVLAAVLTIATPDLSRLFARQSQLLETSNMRSIHEALDTFSKQNKKLPDADTWFSDLAEYTELSEDQIRYDTWGIERKYKVFTTDATYLSGSYTVYYAVVASDGINRNDDGQSLPNNVSEFTSFDYTTDVTNNPNDNHIIKYTDQANKIKLLEETLRRMEKLSIALAKYARIMKIQGITSNPRDSDSYLYFPRDRRSSDPASGKYYATVGLIDGNANEAKGLATLLGLPSYYGEDALTDETMWYVSNPGPNGNDICNGARSQAPFYPPIIMISENNPC